MSAPEIGLDDAFYNRLANSLIATRRQPIGILSDTYATTVAGSASPAMPNATGHGPDRYGRCLGPFVDSMTGRTSGGE